MTNYNAPQTPPRPAPRPGREGALRAASDNRQRGAKGSLDAAGGEARGAAVQAEHHLRVQLRRNIQWSFTISIGKS